MADDFINALGGGSDATPGGIPPAGATQAGSTADIQRNIILNGLLTALQNAIPQATASISGTATAGAATLPANPTAFLTITVSGVSYKLALYEP